jgi:capping protein beta
VRLLDADMVWIEGNVLSPDSWDKDALPERESPTHEPLEIEGRGLGPKRYSSNPTVIVPGQYKPRQKIMADPIDSAL